jgi:hypothetical protein
VNNTGETLASSIRQYVDEYSNIKYDIVLDTEDPMKQNTYNQTIDPKFYQSMFVNK